jgi:hypothetical protein
MRRAVLGFVILAALLGIYRVNSNAAWIAFLSAATLAVARHIRQCDDAADVSQ